MGRIQSEIRDGILDGRHAAKRVALTCPHGSTSWFLLPGNDPRASSTAVELLWVRHTIKLACGCGSTGPGAGTS